MIDGLPAWIDIFFMATCVFTIVGFYYSNGRPKYLTLLILLWSIGHSVLAFNGFYQNLSAVPPRFSVVLVPSTILIIYGLLPKQQSWFIKNRNIRLSTFFHSIRLPMEIVLYGLFMHEMIPELMTFMGRNFDIVMGITAPIVTGLLLSGKLKRTGLLYWNIIGLCFILFVFVNGILSSELPIQQFGFEQANKAVNYFPFVLLPATVVPIVIWTHISDIIKLKQEKA